MKKTGGCQSNFIGNEKDTEPWCSFQRVFGISNCDNWEVKSPFDYQSWNWVCTTKNSLAFFFLWTQKIFGWVTETQKYGTSLFFSDSHFFSPTIV